MRGTVVALTLLVVAAVLVLAGCGSSSASSAQGSTDGRSITKSELIRRGDAICRKADKVRLRSLHEFTKAHPKSSYSVAGIDAEITQALLPPVAAEIDELTGLGLPEGDEAQVSRIFEGFKKAVHIAEQKPRSILAPTGPFKVPDELAAQYGFKECAQPL